MRPIGFLKMLLGLEPDPFVLGTVVESNPILLGLVAKPDPGALSLGNDRPKNFEFV